MSVFDLEAQAPRAARGACGMRRAVAGRIVARDFDEFGEKGGFAIEFPIDELRDGVRESWKSCNWKFINRSRRTLAASPASASATVSSGLWLMPPLPHRTNNMPIGASPSNITASCPAPLGRWRTGIARLLQEHLRTSVAATAAHGTTGVRSSSEISMVTPRDCSICAIRACTSAMARASLPSSSERISSDRSQRPGIDIDGAVRDVDLPDRADQPGVFRHNVSRIQVEFGGGGRSIVPRGHRHGSGMSGNADDRQPRSATPPAIAVTMPSGRPASSSTGPCSIWTSR